MIELSRRKFFTLLAATPAAALIPLGSPPKAHVKDRFYTMTYVDYEAAREDKTIWEELVWQQELAFQRVEKERGIRLGNYSHHLDYDPSRGVWCLVVSADVIA